ncbi:hypothetical protein ARMGADRAFT_814592 [Armillaria gallica]|uniref:Uncharacterized protein n=1 Tax=Armillaria gallica TaxID=47427 RepID=A0A2H3D0W9_ARMGA|nr:hypothetical protein ARMGADRAFT_814592 [Armillaria gallica]
MSIRRHTQKEVVRRVWDADRINPDFLVDQRCFHSHSHSIPQPLTTGHHHRPLLYYRYTRSILDKEPQREEKTDVILPTIDPVEAKLPSHNIKPGWRSSGDLKVRCTCLRVIGNLDNFRNPSSLVPILRFGELACPIYRGFMFSKKFTIFLKPALLSQISGSIHLICRHARNVLATGLLRPTMSALRFVGLPQIRDAFFHFICWLGSVSRVYSSSISLSRCPWNG